MRRGKDAAMGSALPMQALEMSAVVRHYAPSEDVSTRQYREIRR